MRRFLLFLLVMGLGVAVFAQQRVLPSKSIREQVEKLPERAVKFTDNLNYEIPGTKPINEFTDTDIGGTRYDLQTNSSCQNRLYLYDDGTVSGVWTLGFDDPSFNLRGTGYNYFDGTDWGPLPTDRIEHEWTGWPSYAPYRENGELIVNHTYVDGLWVGTRTDKGEGDWNVNILNGPPNAEDISWPRAITSGVDNNIIHTLSVTYVSYNNQDYALLYSRSSDGGVTWDPENEIVEDFGPDYYTSMAGDIFEWAEPNANIIAYLAGENWTDLVLMKSTDDGDSWEKTIVWECPYPLYTSGITDTFYCIDGSHHLAIDNSGKVHVTFGINRSYADDGGSYYFPGVDGVGYWNEDMPTFSSNINALNPYGHPDSELVENYNYIGWSQDIDGNGELDILDDWGTYYLGLSSMVQIIVDDLNHVFIVYSSVTEGFDNGIQNYRHLWARTSTDGGANWGPFYHLNEDLVYIFDECVFPSVASLTDDNIYILYQADQEPGLAVRGDEDPYGDNFIRVFKINKEDIIDAVEDNFTTLSSEIVSQNSPNPFNGTSTVA
ncbi:MAG: glycoside hydrolase, partial [Bacteroidales bacterium]|nr:glycoside hydrolase [Bacteroidales bacterium]